MNKRLCTVPRLVVVAVFLVILVIGCVVFQDYGLSCDEIIERQSSVVNYRFVNRVLFGRDVFSDIWPTALSAYRDRYYGVTMQLPLVFVEDMYALTVGAPMPSETVYLIRHLYTFLVYYFALICFYWLLKRLFNSCWLAIAGVLMLYLFGQFFAHSYYNIKDLLFASLLMITLYCMERMFASGRKPLWCLLFAATGTLLVTSRAVGALVLLLAIAVMAFEDIRSARRQEQAGMLCEKERRTAWNRLLPYLLICAAYPMWILVTPAAWRNPIAFSIGYVKTFSNYQDPTAAALMAEAIANGVVQQAADTRFYFVKHIAASVPVVNQLLSLLGIGVFVTQMPRKLGAKAEKQEKQGMQTLGIMLLLLAGTLLYQALFQPGVYDGWRHAFYLYPILVTFAVYGLRWLLTLARERKLLIVRIAAITLVGASLLVNAVRIAMAHPYEYAMCNVFSRNTEVQRERDYWRSTYYDLAKWVLADADETARVAVTDPTGGKNWIVDQIVLARLSEAEASRLTFGYIEESDYILQNYAYVAGNEWPVEGFSEVYAIWLDGLKIAAVARRVVPAT